MESIVTALISHGDTIAIAIIAVIYHVVQNPLRKRINADYRERNEQLEAKLTEKEHEFRETVARLTEAQNKTNIELAGIKATITEKDKRIAELRDDLLGRNPEMIELLKQLNQSNKEIKEFMSLMHSDTLRAQKRQTEIIEGQVVREHKIDESSESGAGNPMRTPEL